MDRMELQRSQQALRLQVRMIWIAAIVTALLAALVMRLFWRLTANEFALGGVLAFLIVITIALVAIMIRQKKWHDEHYYLGPDSLMVTATKGLLGTKQDAYLYESIVSASFTQNYVGKRYGYGEIHIAIPKLESELVLQDVIDPAQQLPELKARIASKANNSRALVT